MTVKVTDSKGNSDEQDVTVKVTNVEEARNGRPSRRCSRGLISRVTATLADADNITAGSVSWQWYKGGVTRSNSWSLWMSIECVDENSNNCFHQGRSV